MSTPKWERHGLDIVTEPGKPVAAIYPRVGDFTSGRITLSDEGEANMALLLAAPELLAACEAALASVVDHGGDEWPTAKLLRDAIAKTKGEDKQ